MKKKILFMLLCGVIAAACLCSCSGPSGMSEIREILTENISNSSGLAVKEVKEAPTEKIIEALDLTLEREIHKGELSDVILSSICAGATEINNYEIESTEEDDFSANNVIQRFDYESSSGIDVFTEMFDREIKTISNITSSPRWMQKVNDVFVPKLTQTLDAYVTDVNTHSKTFTYQKDNYTIKETRELILVRYDLDTDTVNAMFDMMTEALSIYTEQGDALLTAEKYFGDLGYKNYKCIIKALIDPRSKTISAIELDFITDLPEDKFIEGPIRPYTSIEYRIIFSFEEEDDTVCEITLVEVLGGFPYTSSFVIYAEETEELLEYKAAVSASYCELLFDVVFSKLDNSVKATVVSTDMTFGGSPVLIATGTYSRENDSIKANVDFIETKVNSYFSVTSPVNFEMIFKK